MLLLFYKYPSIEGPPAALRFFEPLSTHVFSGGGSWIREEPRRRSWCLVAGRRGLTVMKTNHITRKKGGKITNSNFGHKCGPHRPAQVSENCIRCPPPPQTWGQFSS